VKQTLLTKPDRLYISIFVKNRESIVAQQYQSAIVGQRRFRSYIKLIFDLNYVVPGDTPDHSTILRDACQAAGERSLPFAA
jgi:hypothetical protein